MDSPVAVGHLSLSVLPVLFNSSTIVFIVQVDLLFILIFIVVYETMIFECLAGICIVLPCEPA